MPVDISDIDECEATPCENNGICTNSVGSYTCDCADGFDGDNCENSKIVLRVIKS